MLISMLFYTCVTRVYLVYLGCINSFLLIPQTCHLGRTDFSIGMRGEERFWKDVNMERAMYREIYFHK